LRTNPRVEFDYGGSIHATVEIYRSLGVGCGDHLLDVCVWLGWPCAARVLKAFRQGAFETELSARFGSFVPRPAAYFCGAACLATAEFADRLSCEAAGKQAKKAFEGLISTLYLVCTPKAGAQ
jgi:hypothetical protein